MKSLEQFAKDNQKFFKLGDEESFIGTYLGYSYGINRFNPEQEVANYKLRRQDGEKTIFWGCARTDVALAFAKIKIGTMIKITRHGIGQQDTSYDIKPFDGVLSSFNPDNDAIES